ncbi:MAG: tetratricopeptide repeat protein [Terriglobia bacterium]
MNQSETEQSAHEIDPDDATVNQALERAQRELRVLLAQAFTAARQGNYDDALRIIDRVLEVDPDNQEAKRGRERLLELKQGRRPRRFRRD